MIILAISCYITQGVLFNLLFPWVISPLIVAWLWLKHEQSLKEEGSYAAVMGFVSGSSLVLIYCHVMWLSQESVKSVSLAAANMDFILSPLYAFALGTVGAIIGYSTRRLRRDSCHK
ncbi:hypothetical protein [Lacimicrobium alkaliphilum]|nr:hypothetical protein [Lacimicrobium alkaliphilum]